MNAEMEWGPFLGPISLVFWLLLHYVVDWWVEGKDVSLTNQIFSVDDEDEDFYDDGDSPREVLMKELQNLKFYHRSFLLGRFLVLVLLYFVASNIFVYVALASSLVEVFRTTKQLVRSRRFSAVMSLVVYRQTYALALSAVFLTVYIILTLTATVAPTLAPEAADDDYYDDDDFYDADDIPSEGNLGTLPPSLTFNRLCFFLLVWQLKGNVTHFLVITKAVAFIPRIDMVVFLVNVFRALFVPFWAISVGETKMYYVVLSVGAVSAVLTLKTIVIGIFKGGFGRTGDVGMM